MQKSLVTNSDENILKVDMNVQKNPTYAWDFGLEDAENVQKSRGMVRFP